MRTYGPLVHMLELINHSRCDSLYWASLTLKDAVKFTGILASFLLLTKKHLREKFSLQLQVNPSLREAPASGAYSSRPHHIHNHGIYSASKWCCPLLDWVFPHMLKQSIPSLPPATNLPKGQPDRQSLTESLFPG